MNSNFQHEFQLSKINQSNHQPSMAKREGEREGKRERGRKSGKERKRKKTEQVILQVRERESSVVTN